MTTKQPSNNVDQKQKSNTIEPELVEQIKQQIIQEINSDKQKKQQEQIRQREKAAKTHKQYVSDMKASKDPWVEIQGWASTPEGVRAELDWNDAFADYLKQQGVKGADDQQIVQQWITLLLRDMADQMEENDDINKSKFT